MPGTATPDRGGLRARRRPHARRSPQLGWDFAAFWSGQALSQVGGKSVNLVLPLVAVVSFDASTNQVGVLNAALWAPVFLVTLFAGAWLDGRPRRPYLIAGYLASGVVLLAAPAADSLGWLRFELLLAVAFVVGCLTAFTDVCAQALLPELLSGERLVRGNSRLEATNSLAMVAAPGIGGLLVGVLGGASSIMLIAGSYLVAAAAIVAVRHHRPVVVAGPQPNLVRRIGAGMAFIRRHRLLTALTLEAAWFNLFEQAVLTLYLVYAVRSLHFSPQVLGLTITLGAAGAVAGSMVATAAARRLGQRLVLSLGMGLASAAPLLLPVAGGALPVVVAACTVSFVLYSFGLTAFNVHAVSLRQTVTPPELLGRVSATYRFLAFGAISVGALVGGFLGTVLGLRPALWVTGAALVAGWAVFARVLARIGAPRIDRPAFSWARPGGPGSIEGGDR